MIAGLLISASIAAAAFTDGSPVAGQAFVRYLASGPGGAPVQYYLAPGANGDSPLLLLVQGSGCEPLFVQGKKGINASAGQDLIVKDAAGRLSVMVVEKSAVASEGAPVRAGTADECPTDFNATHSLDAWTARLSAAIADAQRRRLVGSAPVRLIGLSEGAITVARLAAQRRDVAKVVFISGFGCDQWRDVLVNARRNAEKGKEAEAVAKAEAGLRAVVADPGSTTKFFDGQTHLFWSTFGSACPARDLRASTAKTLVFTGTEDEQIDPNGIEAITAGSLRANRRIDVRRIFGGNHLLTTDAEQPLANMLAAFIESVDWLSTEN